MVRTFTIIFVLVSMCFSLIVAPRRGAWIEIESDSYEDSPSYSRTPQGCVD